MKTHNSKIMSLLTVLLLVATFVVMLPKIVGN